MEEKERYEIYAGSIIHDTDKNANAQLLSSYQCCVILNEQDKRIKELEEQLKGTKQTGSYQVMLMCQKENILLKQQLKQAQKQLAIEELEKLRQNFSDCPYSDDKVYEDKALELCCKALNKELGNNKCQYCCYEFLNDYGSCDCDEQFEIERTMRYFEDKSRG